MTELFGTNGVRGVANEELSPELVMNLSQALGTYVGEGQIALARDTRLTGEMLSKAATTGIQSTGLDIMDLGEVPTPCLQYYIKNTESSSGIMVTASHNPAKYNGIKFINEKGVAYSHKQLEEIERIYKKKNFQYTKWDAPGSVSYDNPIPLYKQGIKKQLDTSIIKEKNPKVVVDPANAAGSYVTPYLLKEIGCKVITLNAQPDGTFPGREPEPLPENIQDLAKTVEAIDADLGIAHDGDADRATFVDETGKPHFGDVSLALFCKQMLEEKEGNKIVTPVSSGNKVAETIKEAGGEIIWTEVGSTTVAKKMIELGKECVCGGEENGGIFFPSFQYCRDGALTAAKMIEYLTKTNKSLSEHAKELPQYEQVKTKTKTTNKQKTMEKVLEEVKDMGTKVQTVDGAKIFYEDSWILIRPSGTEPVIRVFSEAKSLEKAKELAQKGLDIVEEAKKQTK